MNPDAKEWDEMSDDDKRIAYISLMECLSECEKEIGILKQDIRVHLQAVRVWKDQFICEKDISRLFEKELREARETSRILDEQLKDAHALIQKLHKRYGDRIYDPN